MTPTIMRIRPIVEISRPETLTFTAKYRIAPTAIRKMLVPMPTGGSPLEGAPVACPLPRLLKTPADRCSSLRLMATSTPPDTSYALSDDHVAFRDTIRQIVRERVEPRAAQIDAKAEYPWDLRRLFAEQDLLGLPFDVEYGGTGTGTLMLNMAIEEVAKACASTALILMVHELGTLPIRLFGSDELKQRFLPRCASGEWSPAFALSEPEAGSDPARAVRLGRPQAAFPPARPRGGGAPRFGALGPGGGVGPGGIFDQRARRGRGGGDQRDKKLDPNPGDRRFLRRFRGPEP